MENYVNMRRLGERVLLLRRRAALSQHELAQKAGVDVMTISRLEGGDKKRLEIEPLARLALALNVSADLLLGIEETPADAAAPTPSVQPAELQRQLGGGVSSRDSLVGIGAEAEAPARRRGRPCKPASASAGAPG